MSINEIIQELKTLESQIKKRKLSPFILFHLQPIKNIAIRNKIIRVLFGRNKPGLIEKLKGIKISSSTFLIPLQYQEEISSLLKNSNIKFTTYKLWREQ